MLLVYGFQRQKNIYDCDKLKTLRRWVPMNFHGIKKLLLMVSHDLWARNRKMVSMGTEILGLVIATSVPENLKGIITDREKGDF